MFIWLQPVVLLVVYSDMLPTNKAWMTKPSLKNFWLIFYACFLFIKLFHLAWSILIGVLAREGAFSLVEFLKQPIRNFHFEIF